LTRVIVIEEELPGKCERCGEIEELRPYGPRQGESGQRMRVCFDCAMLTPKEAEQALKELTDRIFD
jgi:hypothetical protein